MALIIQQTDYERIMTATGFPIITAEDLELTDLQIKELFIMEAVEEYFKWFPIIKEESIMVGTHSITTRPFPIDEGSRSTWGVYSIKQKTDHSGFKTASPFANAQNWKNASESKMFGVEASRIADLRTALGQTRVNQAKGMKKEIDYANKTLTIRSAAAGDILIRWAQKSENFDDIPFKFKLDVRKLAKSIILDHLVSVRSQMNSISDSELDVSELSNTADRYREEVMDKWKNYTKVAVV